MSVGRRLKAQLRIDSAFWRRLAMAGIQHGPEAWLRYSPPALGLAVWGALPGIREVTKTSLRQVRGPRPAWREGLDGSRVVANFASSLADAMLVGAGRGYEASVISQNDGQHYKEALGRGRGLILATAHTAGWDVAGPLLVGLQPGAEVIVVMRPEKDAKARWLQDELRHQAGVSVAHVGDDPLAGLPLLRHLRRGGIVAMKFDRSVPGMRTRSTRFFGDRRGVPEGLLTLAAVSRAPVLPVFTRRLGFLRYEFITDTAFELPRRPSDAELDKAAQRLTHHLESFVRQHPTQWFPWGS